MGADLFSKLFGRMKAGVPVMPTMKVPWSPEEVLQDRRGDPWELAEEDHIRVSYFRFIEKMQLETGRSHKAITMRLRGIY